MRVKVHRRVLFSWPSARGRSRARGQPGGAAQVTHARVEVAQADHFERCRQLVGEGPLGEPRGLTGEVEVAVQGTPGNGLLPQLPLDRGPGGREPSVSLVAGHAVLGPVWDRAAELRRAGEPPPPSPDGGKAVNQPVRQSRSIVKRLVPGAIVSAWTEPRARSYFPVPPVIPLSNDGGGPGLRMPKTMPCTESWPPGSV